jgi:hypothetical protein
VEAPFACLVLTVPQTIHVAQLMALQSPRPSRARCSAVHLPAPSTYRVRSGTVRHSGMMTSSIYLTAWNISLVLCCAVLCYNWNCNRQQNVAFNSMSQYIGSGPRRRPESMGAVVVSR